MEQFVSKKLLKVVQNINKVQVKKEKNNDTEYN